MLLHARNPYRMVAFNARNSGYVNKVIYIYIWEHEQLKYEKSACFGIYGYLFKDIVNNTLIRQHVRASAVT